LKEYDIAPDLRHLIEYLIDSLDEDGYLHTPVSDLVNDYSFALGRTCSEEQMCEALSVLQRFDPPGCGCTFPAGVPVTSTGAE